MHHAPIGNRVDASGGVEEGVPKRNYGESFERPPFVGTIDGEVFDRFKRRKIDKETKKGTDNKSTFEG